ncbi:unnamed protein product, partial [Cladocopium goreaui]
EYYFSLDPTASDDPQFYFNYSTNPAKTPWQHVETEVLPPCALPAQIQQAAGSGMLWRLVGGEQSLVKAALAHGIVFQNVKQIDQVIRNNSVPLPKTGSGSSGGLLRADKCKALVDFFFADASQEYRDALTAKLAGGSVVKLDSKECPDDIFEYLAQLDQDNMGAFQRVKEMAETLKQDREKEMKAKDKKDKIKEKDSGTPPPEPNPAPAEPEKPEKEHIFVEKAAPKVAHEGSSRTWSTITPAELRCLLPGKNTLPYVYLKMHKN